MLKVTQWVKAPVLRTATCPWGRPCLWAQRLGLQDWPSLGLHGRRALLSCNCPGEFRAQTGCPGSARSLALGVWIGSEESQVRSLGPGERGLPLRETYAGQMPGVLTHRSVLREAEEGHVSVGAAHPVVEKVGGEVGLG